MMVDMLAAIAGAVMTMRQRFGLSFSVSVLVVLLCACAEGDQDGLETTPFNTFGGSSPTTMSADDNDDESGDMGDGDGDGDPSTGDGDPSTGDGDPSTGDGDPSTGDGDPTGDGDTPICGDGLIDGSEQCDGANLGGQSCASLGYSGGTLACNGSCVLDIAGCTNQACGNGVVEGGEVCDGAALNGQTCASQGYAAGVLTCNPGCDGYNPAGCNDGNCCDGFSGWVGCEVPFIENCVCNLDSYCCFTQWDSICVDLALQCGAICP